MFQYMRLVYEIFFISTLFIIAYFFKEKVKFQIIYEKAMTKGLSASITLNCAFYGYAVILLIKKYK